MRSPSIHLKKGGLLPINLKNWGPLPFAYKVEVVFQFCYYFTPASLLHHSLRKVCGPNQAATIASLNNKFQPDQVDISKMYQKLSIIFPTYDLFSNIIKLLFWFSLFPSLESSTSTSCKSLHWNAGRRWSNKKWFSKSGYYWCFKHEIFNAW